MSVVNYADIADHVIDYALDVPEAAQDWYTRKGLEHVLEYSGRVPASKEMFSRNEPLMTGMLPERTRDYVKGLWFDAQREAAIASSEGQEMHLVMPSGNIDEDLEKIRDLMISGKPDANMLSQLETLSFNALLGREDRKKPVPAHEWPAE